MGPGQRHDSPAVDPTDDLEEGAVLLLTQLAFEVRPDERDHFSPSIAVAKNVSFDPATGKLGGVAHADESLTALLKRFSEAAAALVDAMLPAYRGRLTRARASFRPAEIAGRQTTWRHDDTRLHVDSFPATPVQGKRILRLFTNVNPDGKPRSWRVGEPFETVAARFAGQLKEPAPFSATLLRLARITKSRRSAYDALMLQLHDRMKADMAYQAAAAQEAIDFPAGSTWIVVHRCGQPRRDGRAVSARADVSSAGGGDEASRALAAAHPRGNQGPASGLTYCARSSSTGIVTRWRTRSAVAPSSTSDMNRWPCVDIASRSA